MSLGDRLKLARKKSGMSQIELAHTIGVSRGVITNLEHGKVLEPQAMAVNAIAKALDIRKEWLTTGNGPMEDDSDSTKSAKILAELYDVAKELSEEEQLYLLDTVKALKARLGNNNG
jgi:transcriptional regulator with XRE-family HTH domain